MSDCTVSTRQDELMQTRVRYHPLDRDPPVDDDAEGPRRHSDGERGMFHVW